MSTSRERANRQPLGAGTWLRAIASGLVVMFGVVFVCFLILPALKLSLFAIAFWWVILLFAVPLGLALGLLNVYLTIRRARRELSEESGG